MKTLVAAPDPEPQPQSVASINVSTSNSAHLLITWAASGVSWATIASES